MSKRITSSLIFVMLAMLALPALAFDEPRSTDDKALIDMLWSNTTTVYVQQNQYDSAGNYWIMAGFHNGFYKSAEKYAYEGLVLVRTDSSIVALWAIEESWSLTNDTTELERNAYNTLDMTGVNNLKIINATLPATQYGPRIVLFARDEISLDGLTAHKMDEWVTQMTKEADHLKSQYYLAPTLSNNWIWDDGYEQVLTAPEMVIETHGTVRAVRENPSIPEYPMWSNAPGPIVHKPVIAYGDVTLEGWDLDNSWRYDANGNLTTPIRGKGCTPTQDGVPEGNCPLDRNQNIFLIKNNGSEPVNVDGWRVVWYEDIDPIDHDDFRRNIVEINDLTIPGNTQVEYEYQYPYGPDHIDTEGGFYLYNAEGTLVDQFGPGFYEELTVVDQQFKDSWIKTASYPTVFVDPNEFLGLRLL